MRHAVQMDERDTTILMEAVFDIRRDVRVLLDIFDVEEDDGPEADEEG